MHNKTDKQELSTQGSPERDSQKKGGGKKGLIWYTQKTVVIKNL